MTTSEITKRTKNNTFENNTCIIQNSGLELVLIQDFPFTKMWEVKNHKEITHITNTLARLDQNIGEVRYSLKD